MTDIVERLRNGERGFRSSALAHQAADEIESLRSLLAEADALLQLIAGHRQAVAFFAPQLAGVVAALDRIADYLLRKEGET